MSLIYRPYDTAEFRETVNAVIFDMEADLERERRRAYEAQYAFHRLEREKDIATCRAIVGSVGFTVAFGALLYWAWVIA
jgi:hypothetical protein